MSEQEPVTESTAKKAAAKKAPATKKTAAKTAAAKKTTATKTSAAKKTTATKKTSATKKATAKKSTATKTSAKKAAPAKTAPVKKAVATKTAAAKKTTAKKAPAAKKAAAKKATAKKSAAPVSLTKASTAPQEGMAAPSATTRRRGGVPWWMAAAMAALAILTVVALGWGAFRWHGNRDSAAESDAGDPAAAAAGRALPAILSYDYRHLTTDRDQALKFLTPTYGKKFKQTFDSLIGTQGNPGLAEQAKAVVRARVQDTGVMDSQRDRVQLVVFLNQTTSKTGSTTPQLSLNRLVVSMKKSGNEWLVDNITSY